MITLFALFALLQCLKCSAEFTRPANSDDLLCPDCGSSMTVLVSSPGQEKPVLPLRSIEDYMREHVGAAKLNSSSIKTLNGDMSVTALVKMSSSSSSSSYFEAADDLPTQEPVQTGNADYSQSNVLLTDDKGYVFVLFLFCFCFVLIFNLLLVVPLLILSVSSKEKCSHQV